MLSAWKGGATEAKVVGMGEAVGTAFEDAERSGFPACDTATVSQRSAA
jgi:hypothetical protein